MRTNSKIRTGLALGFLFLAGAAAQAQDRPSTVGADVMGTSAPARSSNSGLLVDADTKPTILTSDCSDGCCVRRGDHCPGEIFVDVEYLLMKPRRRNLDFAITDPTSTGAPQGTIESLEWDTDSGVRFGGGYRLPGDGWEVGAFYTYLHSHGGRSLTRPNGGTLFATLTRPGTVEQVDTASGTTSLNYQVLDVEIGRTWWANDALALRCFGGARFAWIDQGLDVTYDGGDAIMTQVSSPINFEGGGVRVGGEAFWHLRWGLGLFANGSASLLTGDSRTRLTQTDNAGTTTSVDVSEKFDKLIPVAELGLGIGWEYRNVQVRLGYELTNWFGLIDSPDFVSETQQGKMGHRTSDLSLEGLVARIGMSY